MERGPVAVDGAGQPFEFGTDQLRRAELETHPGHVGLRGRPRAQFQGLLVRRHVRLLIVPEPLGL